MKISVWKSFLPAFAFAMSASVAAQIPVTDAGSIAQQVQQVAAWSKQYAQMEAELANMTAQLGQLQQHYKSINGVRGMADVANNPALRKYLPDEWQATMKAMESGSKFPSLSGSFSQILEAMKALDIAGTSLGGDSAAAYTAAQRRAAMNQAVGEEGYRQASQRFGSLQQLLEKIKDAPDAKDIADLQARIQIEQVMQQNEQSKLLLVGQLQQAQRDIQNGQAMDRQMKALKRRESVSW